MNDTIFNNNKDYKIVEENVYHLGDWCYCVGVKGTLDDNFYRGVNEWTEVTESMYYDQLNAVPPRHQTGKCFMVGESYSNNCSATFIQVRDRFFGKIVPEHSFNPMVYLVEVIDQFEMNKITEGVK